MAERNTYGVVLLCLVWYINLNERVFVQIATEGRGILPVFPFLVVLVAAICMVSRRTKSTTKVFTHKHMLLWYWPVCLLSVLLPILGIMLYDYPQRTVLTAFTGLVTVAMLALGGVAHLCADWLSRVGQLCLMGCIAFQFAYSLAQLILLKAQNMHQWLGAVRTWDIEIQSQYSASYVMVGRSTGLFINPNHLGFWSVMLFFTSVVYMRGWPRLLAVLGCLGCLMLSQSRGATLALLGGMLVWLAHLCVARGRHLVQKLTFISLVVGSAFIVALALPSGSPWESYAEWLPVDRFERGFASLVDSNAVDPSVDGRIEVWRNAYAFFWSYPFGTLGEPQFLFAQSIDSDLVRATLQGGPLFLLAVVIPYIFGITRILEGKVGLLLAMYAAVILVAAMTSHPLAYPVTGLYWLLSGYHFAATRRARTWRRERPRRAVAVRMSMAIGTHADKCRRPSTV